MNRYIYRVMVNGAPVRHYQSKRAAEHRACEWSTRSGYEGALITVERSYPVEFVRDETLYLSSAFRDGVRL